MASRSYILTTVVGNAAPSDLTTAAIVLDDWQIDQKAKSFIERSITRCSRAAADYCNREFGAATYQSDVRFERGYRDGHLTLGASGAVILPYWPIGAISSSVETSEDGSTTTLVEDTDFEVDNRTGRMYRLDALGRQIDWSPRRILRVVYSAGYVLSSQTAGDFPGLSALPAHLEDAVGRMVAMRYFESKRNQILKSETIDGIGRFDYIVGNMNQMDAGNLSADVLDILNNFRSPVIA